MLLTGGQIVAESLVRQGVPYLLGIPGHGCLALLDAFVGRSAIEVLQVRHEQAAVHMADGYARVTGRPLATYTSIGPGAANTVVGLASAYADSIPALVLCGDVHTYMFGRGVLQELERDHWANLASVFGPVTKRYWQATRPDQLPSVMQRAFHTMLGGRRGPVAVSLPMDVQAEAAEVEIGGVVTELGGRGGPDATLVDRAAALLSAAKRPVSVAGGGVLAAGATAPLMALAEHLGAPVITTFSGKSAFPEDHELYAWHAGSKGTTVGNQIARDADVVFAVGMRFADESASSYRKGTSYAIPPAKLIHADIDAGEIGKNYPVEVGITGDAQAVLAAMAAAVRDRTPARRYHETPYFAELQEAKRAWFAALERFRDAETAPVTISRFIREMRATLHKDAVVVTSSGHSQAGILQECMFTVPNTCISATGFSTMGYALPAAIGVKLALSERQVVGVMGDGDFLQTVQELATAVQYNIPAVWCVLNNAGWLSIRDLQIDALGAERTYATEFMREGKPYSPDLAGVARDFGAWSERVERPDEVGPALRRALEAGRPAVVEVLVNREHPLSGGLVTGWWDVPIPNYLTERRARYESERAEEQLH